MTEMVTCLKCCDSDLVITKANGLKKKIPQVAFP